MVWSNRVQQESIIWNSIDPLLDQSCYIDFKHAAALDGLEACISL